jgi:glycolate oxidase FAD binding subunit
MCILEDYPFQNWSASDVADLSDALTQQVQDARGSGVQLQIAGSGSRIGWLPRAQGAFQTIDLCGHTGILSYRPDELTLTARAGTRLVEIEAALADRGQMLAFEPPIFDPAGTLGGMVAAGLSGPSRPWLGAVRDSMLGIEMINGAGEYLRFGGQVMKNVAGYDVSRLQTGAWGTLGLLTAISLRVHPIWPKQTTLVFNMQAQAALAACAKIAGQAIPLTGTCWHEDKLYLRLGGSEGAVRGARTALVNELSSAAPFGDQFWGDLRDHRLLFFDQPQSDWSSTLWRVVTPPGAPLPTFLRGDDILPLLIEWGGGLRWLYHDDEAAVKAYAQSVGGWCWALGHPLPTEAIQRRYMDRLRQAFDPEQVFCSPLDFTHGN